MPFVEPAFLAFLFDQVVGHDAAVPELNDGHRQPAQAVYHVDRTAAVAERRLAADKLSLHGMLSELDTLTIPAATVAKHTTWQSLRNINERSDLDRISDERGDDRGEIS